MAVGRRFDNVDDHIQVAVGGLNVNGGPITLAALIRPSNIAETNIVVNAGGASGNDRYSLDASGQQARMRQAAATVTAGVNRMVAADEWYLIAAAKAAGTATPRMHTHRFSTSVWTHEDGSATLGDSSGAVGDAFLGSEGGFNFFGGDLAIATVVRAVLADGAIEALAGGRSAWYAIADQLALWDLIDWPVATPLEDQAGTSDQTAIVGTALGTEPLPAAFNASLGGAGRNLPLLDVG